MMLSKILSLQESHGKEGELMTGHQLEIKPCSILDSLVPTLYVNYSELGSKGLKLELGNSRIFKIHPKKHMLTIHTSFTLQGCLRNFLPTSGSPVKGLGVNQWYLPPFEKQLRDFLQQTSSTWGKTHLVGGFNPFEKY